MLNAGKYNARIIEVAWGRSKDSGNHYLIARFAVTSGECEGETCTKMFHFTDAALARTVEDLRACGWQGVDPSEIQSDDLAGLDTNEVGIVVEHETYTDRESGEEKVAARVKWVNALGRPLTATAERSDVVAFGARMKGRIAALGARAHASGTQAIQSSRPQPRQQAPQGGHGGHGGQRPQQPAQGRQTPAQGQQTRGPQGGQQTRQAPPRMAPQGGQEFGDDDIPF